MSSSAFYRTIKNHFGCLYSLYLNVIGMRVSPGKMFPTHVSLGMRVSPYTYHQGCVFPISDTCFPAHISLGIRVSWIAMQHLYQHTLYKCDQIRQKGLIHEQFQDTCTFHCHLLATSIHQQHVCLILLKVEQFAFTQAFSSQSCIHECSGSL